MNKGLTKLKFKVVTTCKLLLTKILIKWSDLPMKMRSFRQLTKPMSSIISKKKAGMKTNEHMFNPKDLISKSYE